MILEDMTPACYAALYFAIGFMLALYVRFRDRKPMKLAEWMMVMTLWPIALVFMLSEFRI